MSVGVGARRGRGGSAPATCARGHSYSSSAAVCELGWGSVFLFTVVSGAGLVAQGSEADPADLCFACGGAGVAAGEPGGDPQAGVAGAEHGDGGGGGGGVVVGGGGGGGSDAVGDAI